MLKHLMVEGRGDGAEGRLALANTPNKSATLLYFMVASQIRKFRLSAMDLDPQIRGCLQWIQSPCVDPPCTDC
jgi:hypothetical protein